MSPENPGDWNEAIMPNGPAYDWRARHWACGWVEYLTVAKDAPTPILIGAAGALQALADYPILDEDAYGEKEWDAAQDCWAHMSMDERLALCRDARISSAAARQPWIPEDDNGFIFDRLRP
jgi:hypothetical protein